MNLNNKTLLITGGTGSFGKNFINYLLKNHSNLKKIIIFSRDELKQYEIKKTLIKNKFFSKLRFFLGDVRDYQRLLIAFKNVDVVIHAAALKQVDTAEYNPMEFIKTIGMIDYYLQAVDWFKAWGPAVILIAGFTIIPFKIFTIMAGAMKMNFIFFIFATIISRGLRFYLVAYAAKIGGEKGLPAIRKNIDKLGYFVIVVFLLIIVIKSWS